MSASSPSPQSNAEQQERRRQLRGLMLLAVGVLLFSLFRKGIHIVFPPGWWRLW